MPLNDQAGLSVQTQFCNCLLLIDNLFKEDDLYHVPSASTAGTSHIVDMTLGVCTCQVGNTGGPCKHQSAVVRRFGVTSNNFLPVASPPNRMLFYTIATGEHCVVKL